MLCIYFLQTIAEEKPKSNMRVIVDQVMDESSRRGPIAGDAWSGAASIQAIVGNFFPSVAILPTDRGVTYGIHSFPLVQWSTT